MNYHILWNDDSCPNHVDAMSGSHFYEQPGTYGIDGMVCDEPYQYCNFERIFVEVATEPVSINDDGIGTDTAQNGIENSPAGPPVELIQSAMQDAMEQHGLTEYEDLTREEAYAVLQTFDDLVGNQVHALAKPQEDAISSATDALCTPLAADLEKRCRSLTWHEKIDCAFHFDWCTRSFELAQQARDHAKRLTPGLDSCCNNARDAIRHCTWSGLMTARINFQWAADFATDHERDGNMNDPAAQMDLHNNGYGFSVGLIGKDQGWSNREIASRCDQLRVSNDLISSLNDPRIQ